MTTRAPRRRRIVYAVALVAIVGVGLASRTVPSTWPPLVSKYPGDALWALMVFVGLGAIFRRASTARLAAAALAFSYGIEALKLVQVPWLVAVRGTTLGHLVFGHVFSWQNLVAYTVGVTVGALVERRSFHRERPT